jgi:alpha-1,2-mannosyltransferase
MVGLFAWLLFSVFPFFFAAILLFFVCCRLWLLKRPSKESATIIGFFHPYCNSGGGGERVLWCALRALEPIHQNITPLSVVIYTGDVNVTAKDFFARARDRFGVELKPDVLPVKFVYLHQRYLVEASRYPRFTMFGQSVGSMLLSWEALRLSTPDIFVDTTGFAFTFPVVMPTYLLDLI